MHRRLVPDGSAAVYLDVSGSMGEWIGRLHAALVPLRRLLAPELFLFSTEVHALSHAALRRGELPTTGGTDLDPVLRHLAAWPGTPPRRVLVLTDGCVGTPTARLRKQVAARGIALHVGLVDAHARQQLLPWAASVSPLDGG
jgi:predicted metal-dependent peptidase